MISTRYTLMLAIIALAVPTLLGGCAAKAKPSCHLDIPDRKSAPDRPDSSVGWCGEACIQMAALYYGKHISQHEINRAGAPKHPDLYSNDIPKALGNLSMRYRAWDEANQDIDSYIQWIKKQISLGRPVLCGMKIYPDKHPNWSLDHFVLATGYDRDSVLINTNIFGRVHFPLDQLKSMDSGYTFENKYKKYFAYSIIGFDSCTATDSTLKKD